MRISIITSEPILRRQSPSGRQDHFLLPGLLSPTGSLHSQRLAEMSAHTLLPERCRGQRVLWKTIMLGGRVLLPGWRQTLAADSLLAEEDGGVDGEGALGGNPGGDQAEQRHG